MKPKFDKQLFEDIKSIYKDRLKGGKGDNLKPEDVDQEQLYIGIITEFEHTKDPMLAMEIALDHLAEIPNYYDWLHEMEQNAKESEIDAFIEASNISFRDRLIFSILSMYNAMSEKNKKYFNQYVPNVKKYELEKYDDNYLFKLKNIASDIRSTERKDNKK